MSLAAREQAEAELIGRLDEVRAELGAELQEARALAGEREVELLRVQQQLDDVTAAREQERARAETAIAAIEQRHEARGQELEKLASGVNKLMTERDGLKLRAKDANARANELAARIAALEERLAQTDVESQQAAGAAHSRVSTLESELGDAKRAH